MQEVRVAQSTCLSGWEVAPGGHLGQNSGVWGAEVCVEEEGSHEVPHMAKV